MKRVKGNHNFMIRRMHSLLLVIHFILSYINMAFAVIASATLFPRSFQRNRINLHTYVLYIHICMYVYDVHSIKGTRKLIKMARRCLFVGKSDLWLRLIACVERWRLTHSHKSATSASTENCGDAMETRFHSVGVRVSCVQIVSVVSSAICAFAQCVFIRMAFPFAWTLREITLTAINAKND